MHDDVRTRGSTCHGRSDVEDGAEVAPVEDVLAYVTAIKDVLPVERMYNAHAHVLTMGVASFSLL